MIMYIRTRVSGLINLTRTIILVSLSDNDFTIIILNMRFRVSDNRSNKLIENSVINNNMFRCIAERRRPKPTLANC